MFTKLKNTLGKFKSNESGATAIEYALIVAVLSIALIASMQFLNGKNSNAYNSIAQDVLDAG